MESRSGNPNESKFSAASFEVFPDEAPLTPLGEWINGVLITRKITLGEARKVFNLCTISALRKKPIERLSVYTFESILQGTEALECTEEEIDDLANIVSQAFDARGINGKGLSSKVPPRVAGARVKGNEDELTTDVILARKLVSEDTFSRSVRSSSNRLAKTREKLGIMSLYTHEEARRVIDSMFD